MLASRAAARRTASAAEAGRLSGDEVERVAAALKALGHPLRFRIVEILTEGERCVRDLAEALGAPQPIVSQQIKILRLQGLVRRERRKGLTFHRIAHAELPRLLACVRRCAAEPTGPRRST
ncbi:MAG: winged helix-turn-helix transcriptional regulator [Planctomycetes bacterium]|nr:winged helix-turn-helix transcriptional regulator [Planctomycetota bacterium]